MSNPDPLTNGSYWGPVGETPAETMLENTFLCSGYLTGMFFGMVCFLFVACMRILWQGRRRSYSYFLMAYTTVLFCLNIIYMVTGYLSIQLAFIQYRNFPGGVLEFIGASAVLPSNLTNISVLVINNILCDMLLLWRCRVIWGAWPRSKVNLIMAFPTILAMGSFATGLLFDIKTAAPGGFLPSAVGHIALAYFSLTLALNVILTSMIVYRIWSHQKLLRNTLGQEYGNQYTSITTMFIESAAIYTIDAVLVLATFAIDSPVDQIWLTIAPPVQVIATYFIIWRVAAGRAWNKDTITAGTNSKMVFSNPTKGQGSSLPTFVSNATPTDRNESIGLHSFKGASSFPGSDGFGDGVHVVRSVQSDGVNGWADDVKRV